MDFQIWNGFPDDFFETFPAAIYDLIVKINYFIFEYNIVGSSHSFDYVNPFNGVEFTLNFPNFGGGVLTNAVVKSIERYFDISISVTFFDILSGPILIIALGYAFIKYLIPT